MKIVEGVELDLQTFRVQAGIAPRYAGLLTEARNDDDDDPAIYVERHAKKAVKSTLDQLMRLVPRKVAKTLEKPRFQAESGYVGTKKADAARMDGEMILDIKMEQHSLGVGFDISYEMHLHAQNWHRDGGVYLSDIDQKRLDAEDVVDQAMRKVKSQFQKDIREYEKRMP